MLDPPSSNIVAGLRPVVLFRIPSIMTLLMTFAARDLMEGGSHDRRTEAH